MESNNSYIETILIERLKKKGMEQNILPLFIKDLSNSLSIFDSTDFLQINNRLNLLGWIDFEMDYHTFQLAKAYFDK